MKGWVLRTADRWVAFSLSCVLSGSVFVQGVLAANSTYGGETLRTATFATSIYKAQQHGSQGSARGNGGGGSGSGDRNSPSGIIISDRKKLSKSAHSSPAE